MSILMRNICRQACPWVVWAFRQSQGWMSQKCSWICFLMVQVSGPHRRTPAPIPAGWNALQHTHNWVTKVHTFLLFHTHPYCLPYTFKSSALSSYRGPTRLFSCTFVLVFSTQILKIVCVTEGSVSLSHSQHTVHSLTCPHRPPFHRHLRSPTLNTAPSLTILTAPSVSVSNLHKRHFHFRLVLKGNVSTDSQASEPLGCLNHLQQILWLSPLEYCGGSWDNSGLLLNGALMTKGGFDPRSKLDPVNSGFTSIRRW